MTPRSILVLGHRYDGGAHAVVSELVARASAPVLLVAPELLGLARWSHHVDRAGRARTRLFLADGRLIADDDIGCVLNRLDHLPPSRLKGGTEQDREYAAMELQALVASWLAGLGDRVVNRSNARAVDAGPGSPRAWLALAATAGLPVAAAALATSARLLPTAVLAVDVARPLGPFVPARGGPTGRVPVEVGWSAFDLGADAAGRESRIRADTTDELVVVGDTALGPLAGLVGEACVKVAAAAGCAMVAFRFARVGDRVCLRHVTTRPALESPSQAAAVAELCLAVANRGGVGR